MHYLNIYIYIYIYTHTYMDKVKLQSWLQLKSTTLLNKINITIYFKNLIVELHILYTLNMHVKFYVNRILFTI